MARNSDIDMLRDADAAVAAAAIVFFARFQFITFKMHAVHFSLCQLVVCVCVRFLFYAHSFGSL